MSINMQRLKQLLRRNRAPSPFESEISAYERLRSRGLIPDGIIDVGAYEGGWTRAAMSVWPQCPVLMIEPQLAKKEKLEAICQRLSQVEYRQQLLTSEPGRNVTFYEMETGSSIYSENSNAPRREHSLKTSTLDLVAEHFPGSKLFVKVDVQGAEIDVLKGATSTLTRSAAVQIEVPFIKYNDGAPSFYDVIDFMNKICFSPIEISNNTIVNGVSVQADLIFVNHASSLLSERILF